MVVYNEMYLALDEFWVIWVDNVAIIPGFDLGDDTATLLRMAVYYEKQSCLYRDVPCPRCVLG
jgi:hypothetical protein